MPLNSSPNKFKTERYNIETIRVANPAAGADLLYLAPANTVVEIVGVSFGFVTSIVVADRWVYIEHYSAANYHTQRTSALAVQAASTGRDYFFTLGVPNLDKRPTVEEFQQPLSPKIEVTAGDRFRISARLIDAADQFSNIDIRIREWNID